MTAAVLTISYSCHRCRVHDRDIVVRARHGEAEDIDAWVEMCVQAVNADHHAVMPGCGGREHYDLKIPMPTGAPYLGAAGAPS